jgi:hypothetical protein
MTAAASVAMRRKQLVVMKNKSPVISARQNATAAVDT